jgi:sporulation protein YlmC with PRC-barrel domain
MKYAFLVCLSALVAGIALADDVSVKAGRSGVAVDVNDDAKITGKVLHKDRAMRSSELVGLAVKNEADEDLGKIEELVIDLDSGKIRYAAVSMGGFLGIGDKMFAVPFGSFEFRTHRDDGVLFDTTERIAVLNINKDSLEKAQGFDQDHWPNFADRNWQEQNDRPYRTGVRTQTDGRLLDR